MAKPVAVQMKGISKYFGDVVANKNVDLTVYEGEILSVLGENGSGKTTLMNMLSGIYFPDEGEVVIEGEPVVIRSPRDAYRYKIGMVHQHFKLVDVFTALDNILLGEEMPRYSVKERAAELKEEAAEPRYVVDNDDAEAPVKTVRATDTKAGRQDPSCIAYGGVTDCKTRQEDEIQLAAEKARAGSARHRREIRLRYKLEKENLRHVCQ